MKKERKLPPKQQRFIEEYLIDLNATQAAIRAGYSEKSAYAKGCELKVQLSSIIAEAQEARSERTEITQDRVLQEEACLAFSDPRKFYDQEGNLLAPHELPEEVARSIASFEVIALKGGGTTYKYRTWDKGKSLERIGRHLGIFNDKLKLGVSLEDVLRGLPPEFGDAVREALGRAVSK
jgi:phage terminase small subunit